MRRHSHVKSQDDYAESALIPAPGEARLTPDALRFRRDAALILLADEAPHAPTKTRLADGQLGH